MYRLICIRLCRTLLAVLAVGAFATSCSTHGGGLFDFSQGYGQDFDLDIARGIQDRAATKADIERMFGSPGSVSAGTGGETWTYVYERAVAGRQKTWSSGQTTRTETTVTYRKTLVVQFDGKGVVVLHNVSESGTR